ncbi:MAG: phosphatase PAP2 family protein [Dehalococcoidia bacterium]|nr:phosphatase PAP2 family protein [Dehalococcoidia bacterium]
MAPQSPAGEAAANEPGPFFPGRYAVAVGAVLLVSLLGLTLDALLRDRGDFDYGLSRAVGEIAFRGDESFFRFFSTLTASFWAITLWSSLLIAMLAMRRWLAATALLAFPVVGGVNTLIRLLVRRPRPDWSELHFRWMTPEEIAYSAAHNDYVSYPSGHVVGAVLLYGFVYVLARHLRFAPVRVAVRAACVAVIVLSGISRVWLGGHWVGDVLGGYALGGLALLIVALMYRALEPSTRGVPLIRAAPVPHDDARPHAHALTSTILFRGDEVSKIYNPGFVPQIIYWLSFQAPFAYAHNPTALRAAVARRNLAGRLTEYWFGRNCVAQALRAEQINGRWAITGRFTEGEEPRDHHRARQFLFELADRFDETGFPTWQIDPRQPRSLGNLLEQADGSYTIIDLESGLVSPLASPRAWVRAIRRAMVPMYDDVYFDLTREYVAREAAAMGKARGTQWVSDLEQLLDEAEALAAEWHGAEPRIWSRTLRFVFDGFGVLGAVRWLQRKTSMGRDRADAWLGACVTTWRADGRITEAQEAELRETIAAPEIQGVLPHLGVHLIIGVALRFPLGSITRASYTTGNLLLACLRFATRRIDRATWRRAIRIHSPLVIFVAAMPGIGTFAYLISGPVRSNHLLARVVFDSAGEKVPFRLYRRLGLRRLVAGREAAAA